MVSKIVLTSDGGQMRHTTLIVIARGRILSNEGDIEFIDSIFEKSISKKSPPSLWLMNAANQCFKSYLCVLVVCIANFNWPAKFSTSSKLACLQKRDCTRLFKIIKSLSDFIFLEGIDDITRTTF